VVIIIIIIIIIIIKVRNGKESVADWPRGKVTLGVIE
jgi:hypothetical protein